MIFFPFSIFSCWWILQRLFQRLSSIFVHVCSPLPETVRHFWSFGWTFNSSCSSVLSSTDPFLHTVSFVPCGAWWVIGPILFIFLVSGLDWAKLKSLDSRKLQPNIKSLLQRSYLPLRCTVICDVAASIWCRAWSLTASLDQTFPN